MRETEPAPDGGIASWGERLRAVRALTPVSTPEFYYDVLAPHAAACRDLADQLPARECRAPSPSWSG